MFGARLDAVLTLFCYSLFQGRSLGFLNPETFAETVRGGGGTTEQDAHVSGPLLGRGPLEPVRPFVSNLLLGKKALVTGGNRGLGEAITVALVKAGAKVCVMASNEQAFLEMVERNNLKTGDDGDVGWVRADLRSPEETVEGARKALEWAGGTVDVLVNNAGIGHFELFMDVSPENFDEVMAVNARAPLLISQVCLEGMIRQKYGKIVNVSSIASVAGTLGHTSYAASKCALEGMSRGVVTDLSKHNIQVNNIAPTVSWTDMGIQAWGDPVKAKGKLDKTPIGRFVEPWEVANIVVFLCSDACTMCLGQTICVDGGFTCL